MLMSTWTATPTSTVMSGQGRQPDPSLSYILKSNNIIIKNNINIKQTWSSQTWSILIVHLERPTEFLLGRPGRCHIGGQHELLKDMQLISCPHLVINQWKHLKIGLIRTLKSMLPFPSLSKMRKICSTKTCDHKTSHYYHFLSKQKIWAMHDWELSGSPLHCPQEESLCTSPESSLCSVDHQGSLAWNLLTRELHK